MDCTCTNTRRLKLKRGFDPQEESKENQLWAFSAGTVGKGVQLVELRVPCFPLDEDDLNCGRGYPLNSVEARGKANGE